jgi:class 3 adenylate cyclase/tetratricopeptide (TPR) repeat protein
MNHPLPDPLPSPEPGRRYVTLLFVDLSQSTELVGSIEAEQYAAVLAALRRIYQDAVPRHGGVVVRVQGDGLLAMFGYPQTRESDGRDAVSAALEMHHRVRGLQSSASAQGGPHALPAATSPARSGLPPDPTSNPTSNLPIELPPGWQLALHSGIHAGLVLLKHGDVELGRYELLGPVPHIASRLSDAAAAHQILVSEETLGPASRFFVTGPPQLLRVKGRAAPLLVYRVDALAGLAERLSLPGRQASTAFVGRQAELALLLQAMDGAMAGRTQVVAVAGAPGMGKTRLIEHFLSRVLQRGCLVLRGYCDSNLGAEPLQPFRHMLQALTDVAAPQSAEEFAALFIGLSERQPLLLFVDDWQWADDASHKVLTALRDRAFSRLLLVMSTRVAPAAPGVAAAQELTLELPPLTDDDAAAATAARLPGADPFVAAAICRQAAGNPLYIEELCHSAARGEVEERAGKAQQGAGWLTRLVESRVQHLLPAQAEMVRVAAVIGNVVPAWLLESITGQAADGPLLLGLAEQDFIVPGERAGTLRFKHGLTRDIIYESVGLATRQGLHLRIAQALRERSVGAALDEALEALAYHYGAGGDHDQAARYAEAAGDKAWAASALDRARALYRAALAALDRLPPGEEVERRWLNIVHRLGRVCVFDPVRSELALYERALAMALRHGDTATVARTRHWLGYISYGLGDALRALALEQQALAEARAARDEKLAMQVVAALGEAHCATAKYERGLQLLDEAIEVKRRYRSSRHNSVGLAFSLVCRAYLLGDRGRFDLATECFDEAASCVGGATHEIGATVEGWRSAVLLWQGRWADARRAADESGHIAEATRSLTQLSVARAMSAYAQWMQGQQPHHLQTIVDVTAWLEPRQSGLFRSLNHGWLCQGLAQSGHIQRARQHAARALLRARQRDLLGAAMCYRSLALQAAAAGQPGAQRYLRQAMHVADQRDSAHEKACTTLCAAEVAWLQGSGECARALLETAAGDFERMGMHWHLAQALRLQSLVEAGATAAVSGLARLPASGVARQHQQGG